MIFLGLLVLKNVLKLETAPVIHVLRSAGIRTVMVTGNEGEGAGGGTLFRPQGRPQTVGGLRAASGWR